MGTKVFLGGLPLVDDGKTLEKELLAMVQDSLPGRADSLARAGLSLEMDFKRDSDGDPRGFAFVSFLVPPHSSTSASSLSHRGRSRPSNSDPGGDSRDAAVVAQNLARSLVKSLNKIMWKGSVLRVEVSKHQAGSEGGAGLQHEREKKFKLEERRQSQPFRPVPKAAPVRTDGHGLNRKRTFGSDEEIEIPDLPPKKQGPPLLPVATPSPALKEDGGEEERLKTHPDRSRAADDRMEKNTLAAASEIGGPRICANCGDVVEKAFCGTCGTDTRVTCQSCGDVVDKLFCGTCGTRSGAIAVSSAAKAPFSANRGHNTVARSLSSSSSSSESDLDDASPAVRSSSDDISSTSSSESDIGGQQPPRASAHVSRRRSDSMSSSMSSSSSSSSSESELGATFSALVDRISSDETSSTSSSESDLGVPQPPRARATSPRRRSSGSNSSRSSGSSSSESDLGATFSSVGKQPAQRSSLVSEPISSSSESELFDGGTNLQARDGADDGISSSDESSLDAFATLANDRQESFSSSSSESELDCLSVRGMRSVRSAVNEGDSSSESDLDDILVRREIDLDAPRSQRNAMPEADARERSDDDSTLGVDSSILRGMPVAGVPQKICESFSADFSSDESSLQSESSSDTRDFPSDISGRTIGLKTLLRPAGNSESQTEQHQPYSALWAPAARFDPRKLDAQKDDAAAGIGAGVKRGSGTANDGEDDDEGSPETKKRKTEKSVVIHQGWNVLVGRNKDGTVPEQLANVPSEKESPATVGGLFGDLFRCEEESESDGDGSEELSVGVGDGDAEMRPKPREKTTSKRLEEQFPGIGEEAKNAMKTFHVLDAAGEADELPFFGLLQSVADPPTDPALQMALSFGRDKSLSDLRREWQLVRPGLAQDYKRRARYAARSIRQQQARRDVQSHLATIKH